MRELQHRLLAGIVAVAVAIDMVIAMLADLNVAIFNIL